uniref:Uncharacterized protein n=1 Tax=Arundo donax TaxID=35708 RepID=A0A0A9AKY7_ARUDO
MPVILVFKTTYLSPCKGGRSYQFFPA